jgi:probable addiction module antidote protein
MAVLTKPFDPSEHLDSPEAIEEYLRAAFESEDAAVIADALGVVARAKGMTQLAEDAGLTRPALYKALSADGDPAFSTVMKVAHALGFSPAPRRSL